MEKWSNTFKARGTEEPRSTMDKIYTSEFTAEAQKTARHRVAAPLKHYGPDYDDGVLLEVVLHE